MPAVGAVIRQARHLFPTCGTVGEFIWHVIHLLKRKKETMQHHELTTKNNNKKMTGNTMWKKKDELPLADIQIVISALNAVDGIKIWKWYEPRLRPCRSPQIYFELDSDSIGFALALNKELNADAKAAAPKLHVPWEVSHIRSNVLMSSFYLHSTTYDDDELRLARSLFGRLFSEKVPPLDFSGLAQDFETLAEMVSKIHGRIIGHDSNE